MGALMLHAIRPISEVENLMKAHAVMRARKSPMKLVTLQGTFVGTVCNEILVGYGPEHEPGHCSVYLYFALVNVDSEPEHKFTWPFKVTVES